METRLLKQYKRLVLMMRNKSQLVQSKDQPCRRFWYGQNYSKHMDLKDTFKLIVSADYLLANANLSEEMLKKVFRNNSPKVVVSDVANDFEDGIMNLLEDFKRRNE